MITITNKKQCSGCSACATACPIQCITMTEDKEGFLKSTKNYVSNAKNVLLYALLSIHSPNVPPNNVMQPIM